MRSPSIGSDGTLYVTGSSGELAAVSPTTRQLLWTHEFGVGIGAATVGPGDTIFISSETSTFALNSQRQQLWVNDQGGGYYVPPTITSDGLLYQISDRNGLITLNAATGEEIHRVNLILLGAGLPFSEICLGLDGSLYLVKNGSVVALQGSAGLADSSWPIEGGDSANRSVAGLTSLLKPSIDLLLGEASGPILQITGETGQRHLIEFSHDLQPWSPVTVLQSESNGQAEATVETSQSSTGFFRILHSAAARE